MCHANFDNIWIEGTKDITIAYYGGEGSGSSPYYNKWHGGLIGSVHIGIMADDVTPANGPNSNRVRNIRIQPGINNFAIYLGKNTQNWIIDGTGLESKGGIGIHLDGVNHVIQGGGRFEGLTKGIDVISTAMGCWIGPQYWSSNGVKIMCNGDSVANNTLTTQYAKL